MKKPPKSTAGRGNGSPTQSGFSANRSRIGTSVGIQQNVTMKVDEVDEDEEDSEEDEDDEKR